MCDMLLFVYSKMSKKANLSSGFLPSTFLFVLLIPFVSFSTAPLLMRLLYIALSCAICSHDSVDKLKSLREALRVSLYHLF